MPNYYRFHHISHDAAPVGSALAHYKLSYDSQCFQAQADLINGLGLALDDQEGLSKTFSELISRDAVNTPLLGRFLEAWSPLPFEVLKQPLTYTDLLPINTGTVPAGAETYNYGVVDTVGKAQRIAKGAKTTELPSSAITGKQVTAKVDGFGIKSEFTYQELQSFAHAARLGYSINQVAMARLARFRALEEAKNQSALFGATELGTTGLLNNSGISSSAVAATGTGNSPLWSTKTPAQIYDDVANMINFVNDNEGGAYRVNTVRIAQNRWGALTKPYSASGDSNNTPLKLLRDNYPGVDFGWSVDLNAAFSGPAAGMIAYQRDPLVCEFMISQDNQDNPIVNTLLGYELASTCQFVSGAVIRHPKAVAIRTGI